MSVGRHVAVKLFRPELAHLPDLAARFFDDARAAALIEDPGIVTVHECGILLGTGTPADGTPFIVMEHLRGESLKRRLLSGRLEIVAAVRLASQLAHSAAAAHARGVIHRDLKPENI